MLDETSATGARPGWIYNETPDPARHLALIAANEGRRATYCALLATRARMRAALGPAPATSPALLALDVALVDYCAPGDADDMPPASIEAARLARCTFEAARYACNLAGDASRAGRIITYAGRVAEGDAPARTPVETCLTSPGAREAYNAALALLDTARRAYHEACAYAGITPGDERDAQSGLDAITFR